MWCGDYQLPTRRKLSCHDGWVAVCSFVGQAANYHALVCHVWWTMSTAMSQLSFCNHTITHTHAHERSKLSNENSGFLGFRTLFIFLAEKNLLHLIDFRAFLVKGQRSRTLTDRRNTKAKYLRICFRESHLTRVTIECPKHMDFVKYERFPHVFLLTKLSHKASREWLKHFGEMLSDTSAHCILTVQFENEVFFLTLFVE